MSNAYSHKALQAASVTSVVGRDPDGVVDNRPGISHPNMPRNKTALKDAKITSKDLGLVVCHGTGDPVADLAERTATQLTVPGVPMVATIASIGHAGSSCGAIDILTGIIALQKQVVPPTLYDARIQPAVPYVSEPVEMEGDYVLCVCHNTEGNATAIVLGRC